MEYKKTTVPQSTDGLQLTSLWQQPRCRVCQDAPGQVLFPADFLPRDIRQAVCVIARMQTLPLRII